MMVLLGRLRGLESVSKGVVSVGEEAIPSPSPFPFSSKSVRTFGISLPADPLDKDAVAEGTERLLPFLEDFFFAAPSFSVSSSPVDVVDVTLSRGDFRISVILRFPNLGRADEEDADASEFAAKGGGEDKVGEREEDCDDGDSLEERDEEGEYVGEEEE